MLRGELSIAHDAAITVKYSGVSGDISELMRCYHDKMYTESSLRKAAESVRYWVEDSDGNKLYGPVSASELPFPVLEELAARASSGGNQATKGRAE